MRQGSFFRAIPAFAVIFTVAALVRSESAPQVAPQVTPQVASHLSPSPTTRPDRFHADVAPSLQKYCYECHGDGEDQGKLKLDSYKTTADMLADKPRWEKILRYVRTQTMPPPEADEHPSQTQRDQLVRAIQHELYQLDPTHPDPGRVTIRRLNRVEYRNTIHDLTAVSFDPSIDFPQDDTGYGFDNIADLLTLPPMLMEKYLAAAEKIMDEAVPTEGVESQARRMLASEARTNFEQPVDHMRDGFLILSSTDEDSLSVRGEAPAAAEYNVRVLAYATYPAPPPAGSTDNPPMKLSLMRDNAVVREIEINADISQPQWYETRMALPAGRYSVRAACRRLRSMQDDRKPLIHGRLGREQPGSVAVKEIVIDGPIAGAVQFFAGDRVSASGATVQKGEDGVTSLFRTDDEAAIDLDAATAGKYALRVQATAERAGNEVPKLEMRIDGQVVKTFDITAPAAWKPSPNSNGLSDRARRPLPHLYELQTSLAAGKHHVSYRFINNLKVPDDPDPNYRDRNIYIEHIEVVELNAPPGSRPMTGPMRDLFARHPKPADARALLEEFATRAWRRPVHSEELDRLMSLYTLASQQGETYHAAAAHAMKAILVSPQFLFRGETNAAAHRERQSYEIDEFELASRLSYFLWSTTPDHELLDLARKNELRKNLDAQVNRMLASPRSRELVENFVGQWLQFRNLDAVHPDREQFENYDDRLRDAMQKETQLFFESIVHDDRSIMDVLTADYTFLNERLADHYGIAGVKGEEFRRVSLDGTPRRGVLTQGSVLTLTSNPTRTSPVKRGKWVLQNLLGVEPLPPPQVVPALDQQSHHDIANLTLRQRMEKHRADPTCASCHAPMDPIGFALENFDAIGAFRTKDAATGDKIDASAQFPDGSKFTGPVELVTLLAKTRREDFFRGATESAMVFALGRGIEPYDQPAVDKIVDDLNQHDGRFSTLVLGVVHSTPFQMRRAERDAVSCVTTDHNVIRSGTPRRIWLTEISVPDPSPSTAQDDMLGLLSSIKVGGVR